MCSTVVEGKTSCFNHGDFFCLLLFQTVASEEKRGLETLMMGRPTNPLHSSPTVAGKFTMEAPCKLGNMLDASPIHHSCGMHDPVEVRDSSAPMPLLRSVLMNGDRAAARKCLLT